jgi:hypothetical protein
VSFEQLGQQREVNIPAVVNTMGAVRMVRSSQPENRL